jgi:hypothetical protein
MDFIQLTLIFTAGAIIKNLSSGDEEKNSQAMKASEIACLIGYIDACASVILV